MNRLAIRMHKEAHYAWAKNHKKLSRKADAYSWASGVVDAVEVLARQEFVQGYILGYLAAERAQLEGEKE